MQERLDKNAPIERELLNQLEVEKASLSGSRKQKTAVGQKRPAAQRQDVQVRHQECICFISF